MNHTPNVNVVRYKKIIEQKKGNLADIRISSTNEIRITLNLRLKGKCEIVCGVMLYAIIG